MSRKIPRPEGAPRLHQQPEFRADASGTTHWCFDFCRNSGENGNSRKVAEDASLPTAGNEYNFENKRIKRIRPDGSTVDIVYNDPVMPPRAANGANNLTGYSQVVEEQNGLSQVACVYWSDSGWHFLVGGH